MLSNTSLLMFISTHHRTASCWSLSSKKIRFSPRPCSPRSTTWPARVIPRRSRCATSSRERWQLSASALPVRSESPVSLNNLKGRRLSIQLVLKGLGGVELVGVASSACKPVSGSGRHLTVKARRAFEQRQVCCKPVRQPPCTAEHFSLGALMLRSQVPVSRRTCLGLSWRGSLTSPSVPAL